MLFALSAYALVLGISGPAAGAPAADDLAVVDQHGQVRAEFTETARFYADDNAALDLKLESWGYEGCVTPVAEVQPGRVGDAIVYDRGDVREWYVDLKNGIEQCFLIRRPPAGQSADGTGELELRLLLGNGGAASVSEDGRSAVLRLGERALFYSGLAVFDASGQRLEARLSASMAGVSILIDPEGACYPVFVDPVIQTEAQLLSTSLEGFGQHVSASPNWLAVGAQYDHFGSTQDAGSVYVYTRGASTWAAPTLLTASDPGTNRYFGSDIAVDGNTILVGARNWQAAYFFDWDGSAWSETQKVQPGGTLAQFGRSVHLDEDLAIIGDENATGLVSGSGAAWLYERAGSTWSEIAKLAATDGVNGDAFGNAVAIIDSNNVAVGANLDDDLGGSSGSVYIFTRFGNFWSQTAKIRASDGTSGDLFGYAVSSDGGRLLIGAFSAGAGACYLFEYDGAVWNEVHVFSADDGINGDDYGQSCSINNTTVAIGAPNRDELGVNVGKVYAYEETAPGSWTPKFSMGPSNPQGGLRMGADVSLSGVDLVAGAWSGSAGQAGYAYSFDLPSIELIDYCSGKTNSQGCVPYVDYVGKPLSLASTSNFEIRAFDVINNKTGLLFYSLTGKENLPFKGATLCVKQPLQRTPIQFTAGNAPPDDCTGVMAFDFYAWIQSGFDANLVPGTQVNAQFWYRDPPVDNFMVGLTNAIEFGVFP